MTVLRTALVRTAAVAVAMLPLTALGLAPSYAGQSTDQVTCDGHQLTLRVNNSNSNDKGGWGSVQVLEGGGGHLTPLAFSGSLTDLVIDEVVFTFESAKGGGHAASTGSFACSSGFDATLGDFLGPDETAPAGTERTDPVRFAFTAVVQQRGA